MLGLVLGCIACGGSSPEATALGDLPGDPRALAWPRRFAIDRVLDYRVASGASAGYVALIARRGQVVYARTTGFAERETRRPMTLETRFQLASMTKPVTAVAAMILVEEGRIDLDDPVADYLPAFGALEVATRRGADGETRTTPLETPIRVRHLLTFSSGIGGYAEGDDPLDRAWRARDIEAPGLGPLADRVTRIPGLPLYERPGVRWRYGWSADVLARVVEVAAGEPFGSFLERRIFEPLGMRATAYPDRAETTVDSEATGSKPIASADAAPTLARLYTHDESGELVRETRLGAYDFASYGVGWHSGGGGLVSSATDYLRFALMLAGRGELAGVRILATATVDEMTRLHVPGGVLADRDLEGLGWGLGLCVVADADRTILPAETGDYWWSGRFGTHFWISPASDTVVVIMQQLERSETSGLPVAPAIVQALALP